MVCNAQQQWRLLPGVIILCAATAINFALAQDNTRPSSEEVDQSLMRLSNLLKDVDRANTIDEQYRLVARAEKVYHRLAPVLSESRRRMWSGRLRDAIAKLPPPQTFDIDGELEFTLIRTRKGTFYCSQPVSQGIFANFLNARKVSRKRLESWFHNGEIPVLQNRNRYLPRNEDKAVTGINFHGAKQFTSWITERERAKFWLPPVSGIKAINLPDINWWANDSYKEKDYDLREMQHMFGTQFYVLVENGKPQGDLPEACYPATHILVVTKAPTGRNRRLKTLPNRR